MTSLDALLSGPRYEVFPAKGTEQAVADWEKLLVELRIAT